MRTKKSWIVSRAGVQCGKPCKRAKRELHTERAMKEGCQRRLLDLADGIREHGDHAEDEDTVGRRPRSWHPRASHLETSIRPCMLTHRDRGCTHGKARQDQGRDPGSGQVPIRLPCVRRGSARAPGQARAHHGGAGPSIRRAAACGVGSGGGRSSARAASGLKLFSVKSRAAPNY